MAKPTAAVTFLLIGMFTVTGHVTSFATVVAQLLSLLFGLLAITGNVANRVTVVAGYERGEGKKIKQHKNAFFIQMY